MIKQVYQSRQFLRDFKQTTKQGKDPVKLEVVVEKLVNSQPLASKYKDHALSNNWRGCRECHIKPDWLLIYKIDDDCVTLYRTGSHSMLFKK